MPYISKLGIIYLCISPFLIFAACAGVVLRIVAKRLRGKRFALHDYMTFLSLFCLFGWFIVNVTGIVIGGYGYQLKEIRAMDPSRVLPTMKAFWVGQCFWATSTAAFRLAILLLYIDLFSIHRTFHRVAMATAAVVAAYWVVLVLMMLLLCKPIPFNWDRTLPGGSCADVRTSKFFSNSFHLAIDIWVTFLPLPIIVRLKINRQKKIGVLAAFASGLVTAGFNLARVVYTATCKRDLTYCLLIPVLLCVGEMASGILVACLPVLGTLFMGSRGRQDAGYDYTPGDDWKRSPSGRGDGKDFGSKGRDERAEVDGPFIRLHELPEQDINRI